PLAATPTLFPYTTLFRSAERARLPPAHRIGEARVDQQIRAACGAPPRRRIQHLPQLRHLAQQRARRRAVRDSLLRDQGEAELVRSEEHTSELQSLRHLVC